MTNSSSPNFFIFTQSAHKFSQKITMETIRPLPMFLGITGPSFCFSPEAFNPPSKKLDKSTFEKVKNRLTLNFSFFVSNYALIVLGTSVVIALSNTEMIMYVALIWTLWWFHTYTVKNHIPISLAGKNLDDYISNRTRSNALTVATFIVVLFYCLVPFLSMICISGLLILSHALMRDPKHVECSPIFDRDSESDDDTSSGELVEKGDIC